MIKLVTYTDERMTTSAHRLGISAAKQGADVVKIYRPDDLHPDFRKRMADVLRHERGAGFYCWKPWVVNDAIKDMTSSDVLVWSDAGTEWLNPIRLLVDKCLQSPDNLFFSNGWKHIEWCKMDLIKEIFPDYGDPTPMGDAVTEKLNKAPQVQASHFLMRGTTRMKKFVEEWLELSMKPGLIDNEPSVSPNVPTFAEHRWDQSTLCCLQILYGFKLHWFPSTTGFHLKPQHPDDDYPAMFLHHRKRNNEW